MNTGWKVKGEEDKLLELAPRDVMDAKFASS